jgi:hypothetical protein
MQLGMSDTEWKEDTNCTRAIGCDDCRALKERFGKEKVQIAFVALGAGASASDINRWLTTERPNPENS